MNDFIHCAFNKSKSNLNDQTCYDKCGNVLITAMSKRMLFICRSAGQLNTYKRNNGRKSI